jgi:uncharacterized RmlC-like cupin family protein
VSSDEETVVKPVRTVGEDEMVEAAGTTGIRRWAAVAEVGFWSGVALAEPDTASGWHHHDVNDTLVYLLEGQMRIEWGPGGSRSVEASAGEFLHVPSETIHREVNPGDVPVRALIVRIGGGEPVVNVGGPDA